MAYSATASTRSDEANTLGVIVVENTNVRFSIEHADLNIQPIHLSATKKKQIIDASAAEVFGNSTVQEILRELSKL